ncbi:MAG: NfeD family protein [Methanomassiliicoccales archaeon]|nr:NfeD family protein [Methanomassiliicoccales archaeon]
MSIATDLSLAFIVIGVLLLLVELSQPGFFILVPATVLLALGGIGLVFPDLLLTWWSPITAVIILVPTTLLTIKLYQKLAPPSPPETTVASSLIGKEGFVEVEVVPGSLRGKVRISNTIWSATSSVPIPVGKRVKVLQSEGVHVTVEEVSGGS